MTMSPLVRIPIVAEHEDDLSQNAFDSAVCIH